VIASRALPPRRTSATIGSVRHRSSVLALAAVVALVSACKMRDEPSSGDTPSSPPAAAAPRAAGISWIEAPGDGDVPSIVKREAANARAAGRSLLVYVGATWCEPCQRFHHAISSGALDQDLAGTSFLEFDADRDRDRLRAAGYASKFIPLFVVPAPDGRSSGRFIEGSIKGESAAAEITPRLLTLIGR